ncbi:unnamed protein product [Schistosoma turkestanicum]|nr:unnamed protein product [Schistosoma turkestanicum]
MQVIFSSILELDESNLTVHLKTLLCSNSTLGEVITNGGGNMIHLTALRILPYLRKGQEELRTRLLLEVIFNSRQIQFNNFNDMLSVDYVLQRLHQIKELYYYELVHEATTTSTSNAQNDNVIDHNYNNKKSRLNLPSIAEDTKLLPVEINDSSKYQSIFRLNPYTTSKPRSMSDRLICKEWAYLPLIHTFLLSKSKKINNEENETYRQFILDRSLNCLIWINYLQKIASLYNSTDYYNFGFMHPIESIIRLTIGSISYPGAGGLGFEPTGQLLAEILYSIGPIRTLLPFNHHHHDQGINTAPLEVVHLPANCPSYYDLYIDLVNHYNALSYNSPVFANLVLWPCQQLCHVKYRRALWGEHQQALNSLRIGLSQLIIPLSSFLEPTESNSSMIRVYAAAILSGTVQITRQPLLFLIAVHHLNRYLYNKENSTSEFTQQFVRLCKLLLLSSSSPSQSPPQMKTMQSVHPPTIGNKTDLLNLLRFYKQPNQLWFSSSLSAAATASSSSPAQNSIKLNTNLHVGIQDALVHSTIVVNNNSNSSNVTDESYLDVTCATTFNEALYKAGIECYTMDTLPKHRQLYWNELFDQEMKG